MLSVVPSLTNYGTSLLIRSISGSERITFTRFKLGDGSVPEGQNANDLIDLVNSRHVFAINSIEEVEEDGYIKITGQFDSSEVAEDFTWRELGLFAKGDDDEEVLYAYANSDDDSSTLRALTGDIGTEQTIMIFVAVGEASNITAIVAPREQYASASELKNHIDNKNNPHGVTKEQLGLGNVKNYAPNDMPITFNDAPANTEILSGETLATLFGKVSSVIKSFFAHLKDKENPHGVTLKQVGGAKEKHDHDAADVTSGIFPLERGGTGVGTLDELKTLIGTNAYMGMYNGDGNVKKHIPCNFNPSAVILCNSRGKMGDSEAGVCGGVATGVYGIRSEASDLTIHSTAWYDDYTALLIGDNGFYVNYKDSEDPKEKIATNAPDERYYFIAYR